MDRTGGEREYRAEFETTRGAAAKRVLRSWFAVPGSRVIVPIALALLVLVPSFVLPDFGIASEWSTFLPLTVLLYLLLFGASLYGVTRNAKGLHRFRMGLDGIDYDAPGWKAHLDWAGVQKVFVTAELITVVTRASGVIYVPRAAFADGEDARAIGLAAEHITVVDQRKQRWRLAIWIATIVALGGSVVVLALVPRPSGGARHTLLAGWAGRYVFAGCAQYGTMLPSAPDDGCAFAHGSIDLEPDRVATDVASTTLPRTCASPRYTAFTPPRPDAGSRYRLTIRCGTHAVSVWIAPDGAYLDIEFAAYLTRYVHALQ